ncbi:DoxX family membrane protein [soil metagenome]
MMETNQTIKSVFNTLKLTFGIVPIVAGLDKFTNLLTNWEHYLHPRMLSVLLFAPHTFMMIVGVIEIIAGVIVLAKPAIGGYIVMASLTLIALTLLASGNYLDVAVRDLVMAIGAFSLARLAKVILVEENAHVRTAFA